MYYNNKMKNHNPSVILFLCFISIVPFSSQLRAMTSPYQVLENNKLPSGLLPKGIISFELFDDGRFEAKLEAPCTAKLESGVRYNASVSGTISPGQIAGLSGIDAQDLFLWFPVLAIRLDNETDGIIHFDVGVVNKSYPVSLFESPPDCWPESSVFGFGWTAAEGGEAKKASF